MKDGGEDGDSQGEDLRLEAGEPCERIRLEEEGAVIKKLIDPKLPTQEAVDRHWIRGHVEYRNWCEVCVRARGKEWDHAKVKEGERLLPEYSFDYFSQAMSWDTSGRYSWGGNGGRRLGWLRPFPQRAVWGGLRWISVWSL